MPNANFCFNPLNKEGHKRVYTNIVKVTSKWDEKFTNFVGQYICRSCKSQIYRLSDEKFQLIDKTKSNERESCNQKIDEVSDSDSDVEDSADNLADPDFINNEIQQEKLKEVNQLLIEIGQPPLKKVRFENSSPQNESEIRSSMDESWIADLKLAISNENTRSGKISLLTTVPLKWSVAEMKRKFNVSRRMASRAKKLHEQSGYGATPKQKIGKKIDAKVLEKVEKFYLAEENSRVMPGRKDYISVVKNGKREHEQKRLLLFNISELHEKFKNAFPEITISLSKFRKLRPRECILAGQSGTHNVCVCKIHENIRLKFIAIKQELKKKSVNFDIKPRDVFQDILCQNAKPDCYFSTCENCPGSIGIFNQLKMLLENNEISQIQFQQWTNTDRYEKF